ncbi:MAG: PAS domain S-box protein, partial [Schleiferiaceae bacterium]|nr:PAS domain S-box protein [Schleiferiaceae bacterium]
MDNKALERRLNREIAARKAAEKILEDKSLELFEANEKLQELNNSLETQVEQRSLALLESEKRYKLLVESAHDLIYITNGSGYITYVNSVIEKDFGFDPKDILNTHFSAYINQEQREEIVKLYVDQVNQKTFSSYMEVPSSKSNGELVWIGQNVQFSYNDDNSLKEVIVIGRNITEKKIEEQQLISTQLQLLSLIENMHEGVLFVSNKREILLINSYFMKFFNINENVEDLKGKKLDEIRGLVLSHFTNPEKELNHVLENSLDKQIGNEIRLKGNRFIKYDYIPILSNQKLLGTLWQFTDITEEKLLDLQIRNSEEKYRGLIENMELGLMEVNNDGVITKVYDWFCKMTGYSPNELIGKNAEDLLL